MSLSAPCPCCVLQTSLIIVIITLSVLYLIISSIKSKYFDGKNKNILLGFLSIVITLLITGLAIFLGVLGSSQAMRSRWFAYFCMRLTKSKSLDVITCDILKNVHGRVLEIGPGPGANFRCFANNNKITEWVGVEPNEYFKEYLYNEKANRNITFPTSIVWMNGENLDIDPQSFDSVVATHVLCSVNDVNQVLHQIKRALKPGGVYYFLEHVIVEEASNQYLYYYQRLLEPLLKVVANGCKFLPLGNYIQDLKDFNISMKSFDAPTGLSFLKPHISGYAIKNEIE